MFRWLYVSFGSFVGTTELTPTTVAFANTALDLSFHTAKPVDTVVALEMPESHGPGLINTGFPQVLAFDGQTLVADCNLFTNSFGSCSFQHTGTSVSPGLADFFSVTVSAPKITSVWITGTGPTFGGSSAEGVKFGCSGACGAAGVPEPATLGLMALGLLGAGFAGRRRRD